MDCRVGDKVGYSHAFLRNTGQLTGAAPFARGTVVGFENAGSGFVIAFVDWGQDKDRLPGRVNMKNLARVGSVRFADYGKGER
jgi:hypothetical protein